ncbi:MULTISPECIES: hypothetical protein [unclassified Leisingera]|uniref:hypothetical protein n=1 Tax=unclassified Leisingera TaxID=2614906 RepID=UPI001269F1EB|nr:MULTISPECIES: hypothetical protein [unclassified Leisingera]
MFAIKKTLFASVVAAASILGWVSEADAGKDVKISKKDVYLMMLYSRRQDAPFTGAIFCPVKEGSVQDCRKKTGGYLFGNYRWDLKSTWFPLNREEGLPYALFDNVKHKAGGQYVLTSGTFGIDALDHNPVVPEGVTYALNSEPGTVFVIPEKGQSQKQAIQTARTLLRSKYGDAVNQLQIKLISAVKYTCTGLGSSRTCTPGKAVNPSSIVKDWDR